MDFDYKTYSLQKLEDWVCDAISSGEATPQEIYDTIKNVVQEQYDYYKDGAGKTNELLALLNGNGKGHIKAYDDYIDDGMRPWGHSDLEFGLANSFLTQDRNSNFPKENTVCDKNDSSPECKSSWVDFWNDSAYSTDYVSSFGTDDYTVLGGTTVPAYGGSDVITFGEPKKDKVVKWQLPVQQKIEDGVDEYYVEFPDDLLEAANLKEGDTVEWIDNGNGTYLLRKV
jgi:hypothetical protein